MKQDITTTVQYQFQRDIPNGKSVNQRTYLCLRLRPLTSITVILSTDPLNSACFSDTVIYT
jgi:hypothetical protein